MLVSISTITSEGKDQLYTQNLNLFSCYFSSPMVYIAKLLSNPWNFNKIVTWNGLFLEQQVAQGNSWAFIEEEHHMVVHWYNVLSREV